MAIMKHGIASILTLFVLSGCAGPHGENSKAMRAVDATDGIDRSEADAIARAYYYANFPACGGAGEPQSEGRLWVIPVSIGYAGTPTDPIFIDKQTGAVAWRDRTATLAQLKKDPKQR